MKTEYNYDKDSHTCTCVIKVGNKTYTGTAVCHEDDYDLESGNTGLNIASLRASIKRSICKRDKLRYGLESLINFRNVIERNDKVYEDRVFLLLQAQIATYDRDYHEEKANTEGLQEILSTLIAEKEKLF